MLEELLTALKVDAGKYQFQRIYEVLHSISLQGMNIGSGAGVDSSGEIATINYVKKVLHDQYETQKLNLFDVGANVGNYSMQLANLFVDNVFIFAFEPSKSTYNMLNSKVSSFDNVKAFNIGLGDSNMKMKLHYDQEGSGLASLYERKIDHFGIVLDQGEEVEIYKLDDFCQNAQINHIHFLKLDVEGHELAVLKGAERMITSNAIDFIQFEFGGCNIDSRTYFQDFFRLLNSRFQFFRVLKDGLWPIHHYREQMESFVCTNYLAQLRKVGI